MPTTKQKPAMRRWTLNLLPLMWMVLLNSAAIWVCLILFIVHSPAVDYECIFLFFVSCFYLLFAGCFCELACCSFALWSFLVSQHSLKWPSVAYFCAPRVSNVRHFGFMRGRCQCACVRVRVRVWVCVLAHLPRGYYRRFLGPLGTLWPPTSALVALDVAVGHLQVLLMLLLLLVLPLWAFWLLAGSSSLKWQFV